MTGDFPHGVSFDLSLYRGRVTDTHEVKRPYRNSVLLHLTLLIKGIQLQPAQVGEPTGASWHSPDMIASDDCRYIIQSTKR